MFKNFLLPRSIPRIPSNDDNEAIVLINKDVVLKPRCPINLDMILPSVRFHIEVATPIMPASFIYLKIKLVQFFSDFGALKTHSIKQQLINW